MDLRTRLETRGARVAVLIVAVAWVALEIKLLNYVWAGLAGLLVVLVGLELLGPRGRGDR